MAKRKRSAGSPILDVQLDPDQRDCAIASNSGGCLIADAIKRTYPNLSNIVVDMATIRVTDAERGLRYIYLTPPSAQHVLLAFDQGWPNPIESVSIRRAVQIMPIIRNRTQEMRSEEYRGRRIAELHARIDRGETLSGRDRASLTMMERRAAQPPPSRPTTSGPTQVIMKPNGGDSNGTPVVHGGRPLLQGSNHPNLLRGRNRVFGAQLADPGQAFRDAVEAEVQARLAVKDDPPGEGTP